MFARRCARPAATAGAEETSPYTRGMLLARWLSSLTFVLALPLFLVLTNVRISASEPRIQMLGFASYDVASTTGVSRIELDEAAPGMRHRRLDRDRHAGGERRGAGTAQAERLN